MVRPTLEIELNLWQNKLKYVCGIDEVGRGSWAGPLVVAGVILPQDFVLPPFLADSKLVSAQKRRALSEIIKNQSVGYYISQISSNIIDKVGIAQATQIAFREVVWKIQPKPHFTLIDAFYIKHFNRQKQKAIAGGDKICASISAASIVAKVFRDDLMQKMHLRYPKYGFGSHKGYGTKSHQDAINKYGLLPIHRKSYNLSAYLKQPVTAKFNK